MSDVEKYLAEVEARADSGAYVETYDVRRLLQLVRRYREALDLVADTCPHSSKCSGQECVADCHVSMARAALEVDDNG